MKSTAGLAEQADLQRAVEPPGVICLSPSLTRAVRIHPLHRVEVDHHWAIPQRAAPQAAPYFD